MPQSSNRIPDSHTKYNRPSAHASDSSNSEICFAKPLRRKNLLVRVSEHIQSSKAPKRRKFPPSSEPWQAHFSARVIKVIQDNISDENFHVEALANIMHLSRSQLLRKVKKAMGVSSRTLLCRMRLQYAQDLLQKTDLSIAEIAYKTGHKEHANFSKAYKRAYGYAPREERGKLEVGSEKAEIRSEPRYKIHD